MNEFTDVLQSNPTIAWNDPLMGVALVLLGLLLLAVVIAGVMTLVLGLKYWKYNRQPVQSGLTGMETARKLLDESGLADVQVKPAGFLRALVYGNYYSRRAKTVFLRKNIANRNSITAVGVATQKTGLALLDQEGDPQFRVRESLRGIFLFAPVFFIIILIVGAGIDYLVSHSIGQWTTISSIIGLLYYLAATVYTLFTITTEKKAGATAREALREKGLMNTEELEAFAKLQRYYIVKYILDFVVTLLRLLLYVLNLVSKGQSKR